MYFISFCSFNSAKIQTKGAQIFKIPRVLKILSNLVKLISAFFIY